MDGRRLVGSLGAERGKARKSACKKHCDKPQFRRAIRLSLGREPPFRLVAEGDEDTVVSLLRKSSTFRTLERNLNGRYVHYDGSCWKCVCQPPTFTHRHCLQRGNGVVRKGALKGRVPVEFIATSRPDQRGTRFQPASSIENPTLNDRFFIQVPPRGVTRVQRRGVVIERIAHETFHAFRHWNPPTRPPKTLRRKVTTAIAEEIQARRTDQAVIREILRTKLGKRELKDYQHSNAGVVAETGFNLTDRFLVERARFPGKLHLTYMEYFALSALMDRAIKKEGLDPGDVQSINKKLEGSPVLDFKEVWRLRDAVKHELGYRSLRILALRMDREWRELPPGSVEAGTWDESDERLLQEHACLFRQIIAYTPHPDPDIRTTVCRGPRPGAGPHVAASCVSRRYLSSDAAESGPTDLCLGTVPTPGAFYAIQPGDSLFGTAARAYRPAYSGASNREKLRMTKLVNRHPYNLQFWNRKLAGKMFPDGRISYGKKFRGVIELPPRPLGAAPRGNKYAVIYIPKLTASPS